jgi:hypothetical protein
MTPLEDKLRAAIHATAEEIPADPPPLRLGSPGLSPRRRPWFWLRPGLGAGRVRSGRIRPGRPGWSSWLAPLAAAAVVVAVVLGSLAVTGGGAGRATPTTPATPATHAGLAGVPPYYVALTNDLGDEVEFARASGAQVRSTATGAVLATIAVPKPYAGFNGITAAADDRTFVLSAQEANQRNRFFVLRIDPAPGPATGPARLGRASLQPLPASFVPARAGILDMALSPDGTSLAAEIGTGSDVRLYVFNLVTGTQRTWSFPGRSGYSFVPGLPGLGVDALSWTADGQHIAFICSGASANSTSVRLLDTSGPGTSALAVSEPVAPSAAVSNLTGGWLGAMITPDGRTVIVAELVTQDGSHPQIRDRLLKVSTVTGKVTAILNNLNINRGQVLYTNAAGNVLVVSYAGLRVNTVKVGILRGDTYTPLPWTATTVTAAW